MPGQSAGTAALPSRRAGFEVHTRCSRWWPYEGRRPRRSERDERSGDDDLCDHGRREYQGVLQIDVLVIAGALLREREDRRLGLGPGDEARQFVREATCPVIALLDVEDPAFIHEAAKRGVFAYITRQDSGDDQFESAIDVVLLRFAEYHDLEGAFGRRALTERAKGILMERHGIDEEAAFVLLRERSRATNSKLIEVAQAVLDARALLPNTLDSPAA